MWQTYFDALAGYGHQLTRRLADRAGPRIDSLKADVPREECRQFVSGRKRGQIGQMGGGVQRGGGQGAFSRTRVQSQNGAIRIAVVIFIAAFSNVPNSKQEVMEVLTGPERRRRWSAEEKAAMIGGVWSLAKPCLW